METRTLQYALSELVVSSSADIERLEDGPRCDEDWLNLDEISVLPRLCTPNVHCSR